MPRTSDAPGRPGQSNVELEAVKDARGLAASPQLPSNVKNYMIDIDGTITEDVPNEEPERMATCLPFPDALETLNKWYEEGHIITFFTSRTEEHRAVTEAWLDKHGFHYHGLLMGKPRGGTTTGSTTTSFVLRVTRAPLAILCASRQKSRCSSAGNQRPRSSRKRCKINAAATSSTAPFWDRLDFFMPERMAD